MVRLYFANKDYTNLVTERRRVPLSDRLELTLVQELLKGPTDRLLYPTIPKETNLISLDIVEGIAFVNFSREIQLKHWGGSSGEISTLGSIVRTLTQLDKIDKVQILVEGKKLDTLLGHVNILYPLTEEDVTAR